MTISRASEDASKLESPTAMYYYYSLVTTSTCENNRVDLIFLPLCALLRPLPKGPPRGTTHCSTGEDKDYIFLDNIFIKDSVQ